MHDKNRPQRVEDYTNAFLGMCGVILFMGFWTIGALFGFVWVVLSTAAIDTAIKLLSRQR